MAGNVENVENVDAGTQAAGGLGQGNYNTAKTWQIGAFAMNNSATNIFNVMMTYVSYYATGILGIGVALVGVLISSTRVLDAITDPIIGYFTDKTNSRFGKFRPYIVAGYSLMAFSTITLFFTAHLFPENLRIFYFMLMYVIYIIGYTCQTSVTRSGQSVMTNHPKQRPLFSTFDMIGNLALTTGIAAYTSLYLIPKYGDFSLGFFYEFVLTVAGIAGILTILSVAGIWTKDREEFYGVENNPKKVKLRDLFKIIKNNRALQTIVIAASTDKLAVQVSTNSVTNVILFGIVMNNFGLYGAMSLVTIIPTIILIFLGTNYARSFGLKKALVGTTWLSMIGYASVVLLLWLGNPTEISLSNWGFMTIAFIVLYSFAFGIRSVNTGIVIPMVADVTDYELYENDRYAPGMIATIFSFIDKTVSSLGTTLVGGVLAFIGFSEVQPTVDTQLTTGLFWAGMFLFAGVMILGWIASLISLKFYPLDSEKMSDIQEDLNDRRTADKEAKAQESLNDESSSNEYKGNERK